MVGKAKHAGVVDPEVLALSREHRTTLDEVKGLVTEIDATVVTLNAYRRQRLLRTKAKGKSEGSE